jgi:hypothetical protein
VGRSSPDLGFDEQGRGGPWTLGELTRRGAEAARTAGWDRPTIQQQIQHGLLEAARRLPLSIPAADVPKLIRSALFNVSPAFDELEPELIDMVVERTQEALARHLDPQEQNATRFDGWFGGPHSSFVHQLAKKKRSRGGKLPEKEVREVLLYMGWRAYERMSECLDAQMQVVQNALPLSLTERERLLYEHMYFRQPYLGDMPLVLLKERFSFLTAVIAELWSRVPDMGAVPIFHRILAYYADMAVRRREIDGERKRSQPIRFSDDAYAPPNIEDRFQVITACSREKRRIACKCPHSDWLAQLERATAAHITITHQCMSCDFRITTTVSREEFIKFGFSL